MKKNKGFTLIELLVVIAIIGILASVVMASLNSARTKAADASVKSNMASLRAQSTVWYDNNESYNTTGEAVTTCNASGTFLSDPVVTQAISEITIQSASTPVCNITAEGDKWAVSVPSMKGGGTWCIDSSGWVKEGASQNTGTCS